MSLKFADRYKILLIAMQRLCLGGADALDAFLASPPAVHGIVTKS